MVNLSVAVQLKKGKTLMITETDFQSSSHITSNWLQCQCLWTSVLKQNLFIRNISLHIWTQQFFFLQLHWQHKRPVSKTQRKSCVFWRQATLQMNSPPQRLMALTSCLHHHPHPHGWLLLHSVECSGSEKFRRGAVLVISIFIVTETQLQLV